MSRTVTVNAAGDAPNWAHALARDVSMALSAAAASDAQTIAALREQIAALEARVAALETP